MLRPPPVTHQRFIEVPKRSAAFHPPIAAGVAYLRCHAVEATLGRAPHGELFEVAGSEIGTQVRTSNLAKGMNCERLAETAAIAKTQ